MRICAIVMALVLGACNAPAPPAEDARKSGRSQGREETRNIRNTDAIGVSGSEIADQVDAALEANDQRNRQVEGADE